VYDGLSGATAMLSDDRVAGDVLTTAYTSASYLDKNVANGKTVTVSGITLGSTDAANYSFNTTATATANISPKALTIAANSFSKVYDGLGYNGGNGVVYNGFVTGETSAVLGGALGYRGSSQGATGAGNYLIAPIGLTSASYAITFLDGTLVVQLVSPTAAALGTGVTLEPAYNGAQHGISHFDGRTRQSNANDEPMTVGLVGSSDGNAQMSNLVTTVNCGVRMPDGATAGTCQ
jgi:hypothetical protein